MKLHEYNEMMSYVLRRPMSMGGSVLKPKRGLVDGPGSYSGEIRKTILANIDNIKSDYLKGLSIRSLKEKYFPDEDLDSVRTALNRELDKVVSKKEKIARSKIEGTGSGAKGVRRQPLFKDSKKIANFEKDVSKLTLKQLEKKYKINRNTVSEYIRNNPELEKARVLAMSTPEMVNERLEDIVNEIKDIKVSKKLKTNSPEIIKISKNLNRTPAQILSDINKIQLNPDRIKVSKDILNKINFFPKSIFAEDDIIMQGFSPKTAKVVTQVRDASAIVTEAASNLEHSLPKSIIREFKLPKKYTLTAERTTNFLNQFKKQFDNQLLKLAQSHARGEINYNQYKEGVNKIRKTVFDKTGGYKIGYVDFVGGKPVPVTEQKSLLKGQGEIGKRTTGLINYFKNSVFHNNLYKNYKANPKDPAFGTLREEIKRSKLKFVKEAEAEKTFRAIENFKTPQDFFKFYKQNPDNIFFKALTKASSLVGGKGKLLLGGAATFPFLATALAAETGNEIEEDDSMLPEAAIGTAAAAPLATKKGRSIYGKAVKGVLKGLQVLGQPSIAAAFAADELRQGNIKTAGASLLAPELVGSAAPKGTSLLAKAGRFAMNPFGKAARAFTPVGLATIGAGAAYDLYKEFERRQALTDEERLDEDLEAQEKYDEMMIGAADGGLITGRVGFAEGPKDPKRRKFIKIMGGLASLPVVGKYFKLAEMAAPVVQKLKNTSTAMPTWFPDFIDKFINRSVGKKIDADITEFKNPDLPDVKVTKHDDGRVFVEGNNEYNEGYQIEYEPPGYEVVDEKTGKAVKTQGNFDAVEGRHVALGPEDYDVDPFYADDLDELTTIDVAEMEKYATGKVTKTVKDAFGTDTGLKKGVRNYDMAVGTAENTADVLRDADLLDEID